MVATSSASVSASDPGNAPLLLPQPRIADVKPHPPHEYCDVRLYPTQMRFVTGIARGYDDDFPPELSSLIQREDFETAINQINNTMKDYWPCLFCMCCGYVCCPCTLGISLLCPNLCIKDAEQYVLALIIRINRRPCFAKAGVEWRLQRSCGRSWIEISYPVTSKPILAEVSYQSSLLGSDHSTSSSSGARQVYTSNGERATTSPLIVEV